MLNRDQLAGFLCYLGQIEEDIVGIFESLYRYLTILDSMQPSQPNWIEAGLEGAVSATVGLTTTAIAEALSIIPVSNTITIPAMLVTAVGGFFSGVISAIKNNR